jgi:hypothetical protein
MSDPLWGFIVAAYVIAALVIGGMTVKVVMDYRSLKLALSKMAGASPTRHDVP